MIAFIMRKIRVKKKIYIGAEKFYLKDKMVGKGWLEITDGVFGNIKSEYPKGEGYEVIEYSGKAVAPGLVDTHIHGYANHDVMDNQAEGLKAISEKLLLTGVTSFLPTTLTATKEQLTAVAKMIGENETKMPGAKMRGIYFEGPFFVKEYKGAQNENYFSDPEIERFCQWQKEAKGLIKKIAIAPEREGAVEFIQEMKKKGVVVALGHSNATYAQVKMAVNAGASVFVHAYNGMRGLNHREPGMVGAMMALEGIYAELICDGHHVHPAAAKALMNACGREHIVLITDCMMAGGMQEGQYMLGEFPVTVKEGTARLADGSLAGSVLQLKDAIKNVVNWGIMKPEEAIRSATFVAAKSCQIEDVCGSIEKGRAADFVVFDEEMNLEATYLDGICRFRSH